MVGSRFACRAWLHANCVSAIGRIGPLLLLCGGWDAAAFAQRTQDNAAREAQDGFGKSVGNESVGIYASEVRGFSAADAGNNRIEGLYFDEQGEITDVIVRGSAVHLGLTALGYPLPAPTGIVDMELRRPGSETVASIQLGISEYLGTDFTADLALPINDRLSFNLDLGLFDEQYVSGANAGYVSYGGVVRWKPTDRLEITGFFGRYDYGDEEQGPTIFTDGAYLPSRIERRRFFGQQWAQSAGHSQNYGAILKADFGQWEVAAGRLTAASCETDMHQPFLRKWIRVASGDRSLSAHATKGALRHRENCESAELSPKGRCAIAC